MNKNLETLWRKKFDVEPYNGKNTYEPYTKIWRRLILYEKDNVCNVNYFYNYNNIF